MGSTISESFKSGESQETAERPDQGRDPGQSQWKWLLILGFAGLLVSVSFNFFLLNQQRVLKRQYDQQKDQLNYQTEQIRLAQQAKGGLQALVQDAVNFSGQHPEVCDILVRHGVKFVDSPPPAPRSKPPPVPPPPLH